MATASPLNFVQEGWDHLRLQRPLAAWASWQRALRIDPDNAAALKALATFEEVAELPAAARAVYRFQTPADQARRDRWNARLQGEGLDDLETAASAFAALAADDPSDADAWLNRALCLAWLGRNTEAIACLDLVVRVLAGTDPAKAADAWTVAEVLRLGAGAETLADDLRYVWAVDWPPGDEPPETLFAEWPGLRPVQMPIDPLSGGQVLADGGVYEWLDRLPPVTTTPTRPDEVPRVIASVIRTPKTLRLSTPDPTGFNRLEGPAFEDVSLLLGSARREAAPLPLAWADAALGTFRFPANLPVEERLELARAVVEHYFEGRWVHLPRKALEDRTPLDASRAAARGDAVARARLTGVVRFREQLGVRPTHVALYQGYPFDRLRRRLGLIGRDDSSSFEPDDPSCMSEIELDALDPTTLSDERSADALLAALDFRDDARTARFAAAWLSRDAPPLGRIDIQVAVAALVRESLRLGRPEEAVDRLERAASISSGGGSRTTLTIWKAEVLARSGRPDEAADTYRSLLETLPRADAASVAYDGWETLIDNGYPDQAADLLAAARDRDLRS